MSLKDQKMYFSVFKIICSEMVLKCSKMRMEVQKMFKKILKRFKHFIKMFKNVKKCKNGYEIVICTTTFFRCKTNL